MPRYSHIFFDLDRTLWDFNANSYETLKEIFAGHSLENIINTSFEDFYRSFLVHNDKLWNDYRSGKIIKSTIRFKRFYLALKDFGIVSNKIAKTISEDYVILSPKKIILFPDTVEVLNYLKKQYSLNIITNGFKDVQLAKLNNSHLSGYFDKVIISEVVGAHKPDSKIFKKALILAKAKKSTSIMIGDDLKVDILGAKDFGIDQIFFNPLKIKHDVVVNYEISSLKELLGIF